MTLETPDADADPRVRAHAQSRLKIIDGDVHPALRSLDDLKPYLSKQWWECLQSYGTRKRHGMNYEPYPKSAPRRGQNSARPGRSRRAGQGCRIRCRRPRDIGGA